MSERAALKRWTWLQLKPNVDPIPRLTDYYGPDEQELKASELREQADRELLQKMLDADDALAGAHAENRCTLKGCRYSWFSE